LSITGIKSECNIEKIVNSEKGKANERGIHSTNHRTAEEVPGYFIAGPYSEAVAKRKIARRNTS